jgi:hypothetical protein
VAFVFQVVWGIRLAAHPDEAGRVNSIAVVVAIFFLVGVSRAWELIGGPSFGVTNEVTALVRHTEDRSERRVHGAGDADGGRVDGGQAQ